MRKRWGEWGGAGILEKMIGRGLNEVRLSRHLNQMRVSTMQVFGSRAVQTGNRAIAESPRLT